MGATDMFYRLFWCFSGASSTSASQTTGSQHHGLVVATPSGPTSCWLGFLSGSSDQRGTTTRIGNDTAEIPSNPGTSTRLSTQIFTNSIANTSNSAFFLRIFDEFFSGFRAKFQKIVTCVAFSIKFAKTNQKFAENYSDLASSAEPEYLVLACEEGGRWGPDQFRLVRDLVRLKVAPIHPLLRRSAALGYTRRWWHILSLGAQTVAADCILGHDSPIPAPETVMPLATVLSLAEITPESSRLA